MIERISRWHVFFSVILVWSFEATCTGLPIVALRGIELDGAPVEGEEWRGYAETLREGHLDWICLTMKNIGYQSREALEKLLRETDRCLPEGTISLEFDLDDSVHYGPEDVTELAELLKRHPSVARFRDKYCVLISSATEESVLGTFFLEIERNRLANSFLLLSSKRFVLDTGSLVVPALNALGLEEKELEEEVGALRMLAKPVAVLTSWQESAWTRLGKMGGGLGLDLVFVGPVPGFSKGSVLPDALSASLKALKEEHVAPTLGVKTIIRQVRGEDVLVVNLSNLTSKETLDASVAVSIEEPYRVHPQKALLELAQPESMEFFLISQEEPRPENYVVRVEAEAEGYRTVRKLLHKVPLISPMMMVLPKVDGDLSDWGRADRVPLLDQEGNERGEFMAGWVRKWLFLSFRLRDVDVRQDQVGQEGASQDHIRIGIDPRWDQHVEGYRADDVELIAAFTRKGPVVLPSDALTWEMPFESTKLSVGRSGRDLIYELALSPAENSFWSMGPRTIIGLALKVQFTDLDTGAPILLEWGEGLTGERSPYLFGVIGLGEAR